MACTPGAVDGAKKFEKVGGILERYAYRPAGLIPILQAISTDMLFTLETVAFLGACGLVPVAVIDEP